MWTLIDGQRRLASTLRNFSPTLASLPCIETGKSVYWIRSRYKYHLQDVSLYFSLTFFPENCPILISRTENLSV